jgi:hypothetical protein
LRSPALINGLPLGGGLNTNPTSGLSKEVINENNKSGRSLNGIDTSSSTFTPSISTKDSTGSIAMDNEMDKEKRLTAIFRPESNEV